MPTTIRSLMLQVIKCLLTVLVVTPAFASTTHLSFELEGKTIHYTQTVLAEGLEHPWDLAILDDDEFLITERSGQLRRYKNGAISEAIQGMPEVFVMSQAGLFDVTLHPEFKSNQRIFLSYAHGTLEANTLRVVSAQLSEQSLSEFQVVFEVEPYKDTPVHYGGRLALLPDNSLLITTGDGFDYREKAQSLDNLLGKVARVFIDGSIPQDNPYFSHKGAKRTIWTLGHRNPQGLIYDAQRKLVFLHEHGPKGGDEINVLEAGKNYGWPIATHGKDYSGAQISPFTEYPGTEQPLLHWTPSIAPSGLAVYYGEQFSELNGSLLIGALVDRDVKLLRFDDRAVTAQASLFSHLDARVRAVYVGQNGEILLLTDSAKGQLIKIERVFK